jgi:hypothetical protein
VGTGRVSLDWEEASTVALGLRCPGSGLVGSVQRGGFIGRLRRISAEEASLVEETDSEE